MNHGRAPAEVGLAVRRSERNGGCINRLQWRRGLDLIGVPPEIVAQTDRLSEAAGGLLVRPSPSVEGANAKLVQILELWVDRSE